MDFSSVYTPLEARPLIAEYEQKFGEGYPSTYLGEVNIERIKECIATNTPVPRSEYEHLLGCDM